MSIFSGVVRGNCSPEWSNSIADGITEHSHMKNTGFEIKRRMIDFIDENWNAAKAKDKIRPGGCVDRVLAGIMTGASSSA